MWLCSSARLFLLSTDNSAADTGPLGGLTPGQSPCAEVCKRPILSVPPTGGSPVRIPRRVPLAVPLALALAATAGRTVGSGQQTVPFQGGIPVAPTGLANRPLPDRPMEFDTGEGQRIRVVVMTKGLKFPWALTFTRSEEHTSELQSQSNLVCRLLLEKK